MKRILSVWIIFLLYLQVMGGFHLYSKGNIRQSDISTIPSLSLVPFETMETVTLDQGNDTRSTDKTSRSLVQIENDEMGGSWFDDFDDTSGISQQQNVNVSGGKVNNDLWMFKKPLTITSNGGPFSNYPLNLTLEPANFDYSKANPRGDDIRFKDSDENNLNYWIEEWNSSGVSKIWVNITSMSLGISQIWLIYGNPHANPASNGTKVFSYFDHWVTDNTGNWIYGTPDIDNNHHTYWENTTSQSDDRILNTQFSIKSWNKGAWDWAVMGWSSNRSSLWDEVDHCLVQWSMKESDGANDSLIPIRLSINNGPNSSVTPFKYVPKPNPDHDLSLKIYYRSERVAYEWRDLTNGSLLAADEINGLANVSSPAVSRYYFLQQVDSAGGNFSWLPPTHLKWGNHPGNGGCEWQFDYWFIRKYSVSTSINYGVEVQGLLASITSIPVILPDNMYWDVLSVIKSEPIGTNVKLTLYDTDTGSVINKFENLTDSNINLSHLNEMNVGSISVRAFFFSTPRVAPFMESWGVQWVDSLTWRDSFTGKGMCSGGVEGSTDMNTVGLWHFNEVNGNAIIDESGLGNNGTMKNMNPGNRVIGRFAGGLKFNGSTNYVEILNKPSLRNVGNFTIGAWTRRMAPYLEEDWRNIGTIASKGRDVQIGSYNLQTSVNSSNYIRYIFNIHFLDSAANGDTVEWQSPFLIGTWHHVAARYAGVEMSLWVDGVMRAKKDVRDRPTTVSQSHFSIGRMTGSESRYYFGGEIDEVRLSNVARTQEEIMNDYLVGISISGGRAMPPNEYSNVSLLSNLVYLPSTFTWSTLRIHRSVPENTFLNISIHDAVTEEILLSEITDLDTAELDLAGSINAREHGIIYLKANFISNRQLSPVLFDWALNWSLAESPRYLVDINDIVIPEETTESRLLNLSKHFYDRYHKIEPSQYTLENISDNTNLILELIEDELHIAELSENYSGNISLSVISKNIYGLETRSNQFFIRVINEDDPPVWISTPPPIVLQEDANYTTDWSLIEYIFDGDGNPIDPFVSPSTNLISIRLEKDLRITIIPSNDFFGETSLEVYIRNISTPSRSAQNMSIPVTVIAVNDAPLVSLISPADEAVSGDVNVTFSFEAYDPDNGLEELRYDLYMDQNKDPGIFRTNIPRGITIRGLGSGLTYYWYVLPHDGKLSGECSNGIYSFTVDEELEFPKVNLLSPLSGMVYNKTEVTLTWESTESARDTLRYRILLGPSKDNMIEIATITETSHLLTDLSVGLIYHWTVIPISGKNEGRCSSGINSFTIDTGFQPVYKVSIESNFSLVKVPYGAGSDFNITLVNNGNLPVKANLFIEGIIKGFADITNSVVLSPGESKRVQVSIYNTSSLNPGEYNLSIEAHHAGGVNKITFRVDILPKPQDSDDDTDQGNANTVKETSDSIFIYIILGSLALIVGVIIIIIVLMKKQKRSKEKRAIPGGTANAKQVEPVLNNIQMEPIKGQAPSSFDNTAKFAPSVKHSYARRSETRSHAGVGIPPLSSKPESSSHPTQSAIPSDIQPSQTMMSSTGATTTTVPVPTASDTATNHQRSAENQVSMTKTSSPPAPQQGAHGPQIIGVDTGFGISDLFLVYVDGRLIKSVSFETQLRENMDEDIMSGMLTAITDFIKDSFKEDSGALKTLQYGKMTIFLERGVGMYLAVVFHGTAPPELREKIRFLLIRLWEKYKYRLKVWDGSEDGLEGLDTMLESIMADRIPEEEPEEPPEEPPLESPAGLPAISTATEAIMCAICMGVVKPGLEIMTCSCGSKLHRSCGERVETCPKCGVSLVADVVPEEKEEKSTGPRRSTATEAIMCGICMGVVKPGLDIITCNCGKIFHPSCAERIGECPKCQGTIFLSPPDSHKEDVPTGDGAMITGTTEAILCKICLGVIKPSLPVLNCKCGVQYHEACAVRLGNCPECGADCMSVKNLFRVDSLSPELVPTADRSLAPQGDIMQKDTLALTQKVEDGKSGETDEFRIDI
jgi:hypothetical protein